MAAPEHPHDEHPGGAVAVTGPELPPDRRARAVRAYHALPAEDRREAVGLARQGRRHPDERVAAVAWWYAAAVLQPRWYNRVPVVVLPLVALALEVVAFAVDAWPVALLGLVTLLVGAGLAWQRASTTPLLRLMRPADTPE
ncbi:hypothetical protein GTR02_15970 [Kineococcus sp. R8]|uniref:hypothetical protein n=1 Tax=Kineococcus siccus TaxID=2696567 RepID=UPI001411DA4A|nr:hypothetical protein [Kineococcus siccus]NAZ83317.1 hypothetical protein [Kineococcus siccus]